MSVGAAANVKVAPAVSSPAAAGDWADVRRNLTFHHNSPGRGRREPAAQLERIDHSGDCRRNEWRQEDCKVLREGVRYMFSVSVVREWRIAVAEKCTRPRTLQSFKRMAQKT